MRSKASLSHASRNMQACYGGDIVGIALLRDEYSPPPVRVVRAAPATKSLCVPVERGVLLDIDTDARGILDAL